MTIDIFYGFNHAVITIKKDLFDFCILKVDFIK